MLRHRPRPVVTFCSTTPAGGVPPPATSVRGSTVGSRRRRGGGSIGRGVVPVRRHRHGSRKGGQRGHRGGGIRSGPPRGPVRDRVGRSSGRGRRIRGRSPRPEHPRPATRTCSRVTPDHRLAGDVVVSVPEDQRPSRPGSTIRSAGRSENTAQHQRDLESAGRRSSWASAAPGRGHLLKLRTLGGRIVIRKVSKTTVAVPDGTTDNQAGTEVQ